MDKYFSWFLGFLASDGSIVRPTYRRKGDESHISFCIHHDDGEVLYKIKEILKTKANVRLYPNYDSPQAQINIYDRKDIICDFEDIKDIVPNGVLMRHYIRGVCDGDGCLAYRFNRNSFRINIVNESYGILNSICTEISNIFNISKKKPRWKSQDNLYIIEWEGKIARLIAWWLYSGDIDGCVLQRKLDKYIEFVLCGEENRFKPDEIFVATGNKGEYLINKHSDGIIISMMVDSRNSLRWAKIFSKIIKRSTPIPVNKGQRKYYSLYIPVINTQSIQVDEDIVQ